MTMSMQGKTALEWAKEGVYVLGGIFDQKEIIYQDIKDAVKSTFPEFKQAKDTSWCVSCGAPHEESNICSYCKTPR